jgi:hypothetical protein
VATGWGTIDASRFVPALVAAVRAEEAKPHSPRQQAAAALTALRKAAHLSSTTIAAGASSSLAANGFLPKHPVRLAIDGHPVTTLTANAVGAVGYVVDPGTLRLTPGPHTLTLTSMLITDTTTFTSH